MQQSNDVLNQFVDLLLLLLLGHQQHIFNGLIRLFFLVYGLSFDLIDDLRVFDKCVKLRNYLTDDFIRLHRCPLISHFLSIFQLVVHIDLLNVILQKDYFNFPLLHIFQSTQNFEAKNFDVCFFVQNEIEYAFGNGLIKERIIAEPQFFEMGQLFEASQFFAIVDLIFRYIEFPEERKLFDAAKRGQSVAAEVEGFCLAGNVGVDLIDDCYAAGGQPQSFVCYLGALPNERGQADLLLSTHPTLTIIYIITAKQSTIAIFKKVCEGIYQNKKSTQQKPSKIKIKESKQLFDRKTQQKTQIFELASANMSRRQEAYDNRHKMMISLGLLFFIRKILLFRGDNNSADMRSKQRRTHKHTSPNTPISPSAPLTPNPHLKTQPSSEQSPLSPLHHKGNVEVLLRENNQLRREIVELKVHQFYHFDDFKLKELIQELQALRKEVKKHQQVINDLQTENDFLTRTNAHLKVELQKEIQARTKEAYAQDTSKCTLPRNNSLSRCSDDEPTHLANSTSSSRHNTTLALEDSLPYRSPEPTQSRLSRRQLVEKCLSPKHARDASSETANEYLLYRRGRDKNILGKFNE